MTSTNKKIRVAMTEHDLRQWEVAELLGVSETTFYRMMRKELSEDEQERIVQTIKEGVKK